MSRKWGGTPTYTLSKGISKRRGWVGCKLQGVDDGIARRADSVLIVRSSRVGHRVMARRPQWLRGMQLCRMMRCGTISTDGVLPKAGRTLRCIYQKPGASQTFCPAWQLFSRPIRCAEASLALELRAGECSVASC